MAYGIVTGDLGDALRTDRDTPFMSCIAEKWDAGANGSFYKATGQEEALMKLQKRTCIYVTSMDKVQYNKMCHSKAFQALFPHVIYLNDLTKSEKLELLRLETHGYGLIYKHKNLLHLSCWICL